MRDGALVMPKMSMTMEQGQIVVWHFEPGAHVRAGDPVCDVLTDKVDMEVESPVEGTLARIVADVGATIPVGDPIAYIATEADELLEGLIGPDGVVGGAGDTDAAPIGAGAPVEPGSNGADRLATPPSRQGPRPVVPGARSRAAQLKIDLATITGTGTGGLITMADVDRAAQAIATKAPSSAQRSAVVPTATGATLPAASYVSAAPPVPDAPPTGSPPLSTAGPRLDGARPDGARFDSALETYRRSVRQTVARVMTESATVPQFTAYADLDLRPLAAARRGIGWTTLLAVAFAKTLRLHLELASTWVDGQPQPADRIGIALAVDTPVGLLAPVVIDADRRPADDVERDVRRVVASARDGHLGPDAMSGATATLSNLGTFGVTRFQALVTPPQVCALSVGAIGEMPFAAGGGTLGVRLGCTVGLTVDHRAADGADAGRFLADLADLFRRPDSLLAPG